jgi:hypothetical protein
MSARGGATPRAWALSLSVAVALTASVGTVAAQVTPTGGEWIIADSEFADLWYHGLVVIGFDGPDQRPLYPADSPFEGGRDSSRLRDNASALHSALKAETAFELLHFVPVYFAGVSRPEAMEALHRVADGRAVRDGLSPAARRGAEIVRSVLSEGEQRRTLGRFLDGLDDEWTFNVAAQRQALRAATRARIDELRGGWDDYARALAPYLAQRRLSGGVIIPSAAVGTEGRFFQGRSDRSDDNVVVIRMPHDAGQTGAVLSAVVRELCFPAVRDALAVFEPDFTDRSQAMVVSDRAATRCGAILLQLLAPHHTGVYTEVYGSDPAWLESELGQAVDAALERQLRMSAGDAVPAHPTGE